MVSKELAARIKEALASNPADMTPEERSSVFSDELVGQIRDAVSSSANAMSPDQILNDLNSLIGRVLKSLGTIPDSQIEKNELQVFKERLRLLEKNHNAQDVRRLSTEFYTLVESNPKMRNLYREVTEKEIEEILSSKIQRGRE